MAMTVPFDLADEFEVNGLVLTSRGEQQVPLPALMKGIVAPSVVGKNEKLVKRYIANLSQRFGGEHSKESISTCIKS